MFKLATRGTVQSLREKFQFLVVTTLFFPVTISAFFSSIEKVNHQIISWGLVVALLIINYVFIEYLKDKMLFFVARYSEILITLSIISYIPVFMVFAILQESPTSFMYVLVMAMGIAGTIVIPGILSFLLVSNILIHLLPEEILWVYKKILKMRKKSFT